ncbi:MAG: universal stress protein [Ornithinimicrobium sp.]
MASQSSKRPVVVGYDGSTPSEAALQWAAKAADHQGRPLRVLHAAERITYTQDAGAGKYNPSEIISEAAERAERGADAVRSEFPNLEVSTAGSLFSAKVALGEASTQAALMVLGSQGRGRVGTALLGSTSYAIAAYAKCPVVIVRDGESELPGPEHPVSVAANGTGGSQRAIDAAVDLAREWNAPLSLVTLWAPAPPDPWGKGPIGYDSTEAASADYKATAERVNAEALEEIGGEHQDLSVNGRVIEAEAVEGLSKVADEGGVLVLGTRGHGAMVGSILGSVSLGVLSQSSAPIMIVD